MFSKFLLITKKYQMYYNQLSRIKLCAVVWMVGMYQMYCWGYVNQESVNSNLIGIFLPNIEHFRIRIWSRHQLHCAFHRNCDADPCPAGSKCARLKRVSGKILFAQCVQAAPRGFQACSLVCNVNISSDNLLTTNLCPHPPNLIALKFLFHLRLWNLFSFVPK